MLDYAQSFEEFSRGLKPVDLALYAGVALVAWVFLKDKTGPLQNTVKSVVDKVKELLSNNKAVTKNTTPTLSVKNEVKSGDEDVFFDLVVSWKQTRDLAVKSKCSQAVKVADQMFPYLSPTVCKEKELTNE